MAAQERKLRRLIEKAGVKPGHHVLEIGFGCARGGLLLVVPLLVARVCGSAAVGSKRSSRSVNCVRAAGTRPCTKGMG